MKHFWRKLVGKGNNESTRVFGMTHPGMRRENNEDAFAVLNDRDIVILADGMGGHNAGEVAAEHAIQFLDRYFGQDLVQSIREDETKIQGHMKDAFIQASQSVYEKSKEDPSMEGMGCALITAYVSAKTLHLCHVGDVRCYISVRSGIEQITNDHSYVWDLVRSGQLTREEARHHRLKNIITQCIGQQYPPDPEYQAHRICENERIMLCSDGLWDMLSDEQIQATLLAERGTDKICKMLIDRANKAGGFDNITVIIVEGKGIIEENESERMLE